MGTTSRRHRAVASDVVDNAGGIGPVQQQYAADVGFKGSNPAQGVTAVQNASGVHIAHAGRCGIRAGLRHAAAERHAPAQFRGLDPHVYNPSTYSYLLTPTKGWAVAKGATMSQFVNYALTLGQQTAPSFWYASLGLSLERYGIDAVIRPRSRCRGGDVG